MNSTSSVSHEKISRRAFQIWEETGRRDGDETAHWLRAESELRAEHGKTGGVERARGKSVEPTSAGKRAGEKARHSTDYAHPGVTTDSVHHLRTR
jgi:hypothetical protein